MDTNQYNVFVGLDWTQTFTLLKRRNVNSFEFNETLQSKHLVFDATPLSVFYWLAYFHL